MFCQYICAKYFYSFCIDNTSQPCIIIVKGGDTVTINDRIKDIRRSTGLSQTDFAERLGTTRGVITNLEGEKTTPNEPFIKLICREFNIDEHWLRTGEGEMRQKLTRNQEIAEFMGVVMHDPDDAPRKRFVSIISKLSADEWQLLAEIAKKMAEDE